MTHSRTGLRSFVRLFSPRRFGLILAACFMAIGAHASALKISDSAAQQIHVLDTIKLAKTGTQNKIDSRLYLGLLNLRSDSRLRGLPSFRFVKAESDGMVPVDIMLSGADGVKPVINQLDTLGAVVKSKSYVYRRVSARVHLTDLETLAAIPQVRKILRHMPGLTQKINTSEGDTTHGANEARSFFGVTGAGVKVCVLSDGVDSLATLQASGDLPPVVTILPGQAGSGDEGSAMLEIVHDLAPGAALEFATADTDEASFAANILGLGADGCNVIVDDVLYLDESPFEDGPLAQAVSTVTANGALYFSAAGNYGNKSDGSTATWEGDFNGNGTPAAIAGAGPVHNFGDGGQSIGVTATGSNVVLIWAEHYDLSGGSASTDFDLYDMDSGLTAVYDASTNTQDGVGGDDVPVEAINDTFAGERLVVAEFASGTTSSVPMFNLLVVNGALDPSLGTTGSTRGHSSAANAFSVAATPAAVSFDGVSGAGPYPGAFNSGNVCEDFTSDGPRRIILDTTGAEITPGNRTSTGGVVRLKPDFAAADGVSTAAPGFNPFYGTSAAAPHAAAIAALLKSAVPSLTQVQVRNALVASAIDIETPGISADSGAGIIMAHAALQSVGAVAQATLTNGTPVTTQVAGDGDASIEPNEIWNIAVPLTNTGGTNATAVSAVLSSSTPGVTITSDSSAYPDLAAGGSGSNVTPFTFRVESAASCGSMIDFTLTVTFTGGASPQVFNFSLPTGEAGTPTDFSYSGPAVPIPDGNDLSGTSPGAPATAPLVVSGLPGGVYAMTFSIDGTACNATSGSTTVGLDHSFVNDLTISLLSPDGTPVVLINHTDGGGNNFCQTVLSDTAVPSIQSVASADAPFTNSYTPNAPLSGFRGKNPNGTWMLQAQDFFSQDTGNIRAFSAHITPAVCNAPPLTTLVTATKTVSGTFNPGTPVTYTVTLSNSGTAAQADNPGHEFVDVLPSNLTLVSATTTAGTAVASAGTNTVTWDGSIVAGGSVTITITATINAGVADGTAIANQGTVNYDADVDGTNESSVLTDDPGVGGASDPTSFNVVVPPTPLITATKNVSGGTQQAGGTVAYTVVLTNSGNATQADNPGNEFTDVLPAQLTLVSASATSGTAVASTGTNTVVWNGAIASMASVTITINATIATGTAGQTISNQGTFSFDANDDGTNESSGVTNAVGGGPATFVVQAAPAAVIAATKTIGGGTLTAGGTVIYTVTLTNSGLGAQSDNAGNEFTDTLPSELTVGTPTASSGTVSGTGVNPVTWNGSIASGGSVTITIPATIAPTATGAIANQGTASYDSDGDGVNDTTVQTDDPRIAGAADPTVFTVNPRVATPTTPVPTLSWIAMAILFAFISIIGFRWRQRHAPR